MFFFDIDGHTKRKHQTIPAETWKHDGVLESIFEYIEKDKKMSDERNPETDSQDAPIVNDNKFIQDMVIEDIEERKQFGIRKYGTALQAGNGRDHLQDAYEEILDLAVYIRGVIEEIKAIEKKKLDFVALTGKEPWDKQAKFLEGEPQQFDRAEGLTTVRLVLAILAADSGKEVVFTSPTAMGSEFNKGRAKQMLARAKYEWREKYGALFFNSGGSLYFGVLGQPSTELHNYSKYAVWFNDL